MTNETFHDKFTSIVILSKGSVNSLLGMVHIAGAFTFEAREIAGQGTAKLEHDYIVWFFLAGVFVLFMGLVDVFCYQGLRAGVRLAWQLSFLCSVFTTLVGLIGVSMYGVSPPLVLLLTGLTGLIVLASTRRKYAMVPLTHNNGNAPLCRGRG